MTKNGGKMGKGRSKSSGIRNNDRPNGKSWKKNPKKPRKTGRTIGGYSLKKLETRKKKRENNGTTIYSS